MPSTIRFREVANAFAEDVARLEREVPSVGFSSEDEVNDAVDKLDSLAQTAVAVDVQRARELEQGRTLPEAAGYSDCRNLLTYSSKIHLSRQEISISWLSEET